MMETATIVLKTRSKTKINLLLQIAREMGIYTERMKRYHRQMNDEVTILSQESLAEAWNSAEDERWDELYKK